MHDSVDHGHQVPGDIDDEAPGRKLAISEMDAATGTYAHRGDPFPPQGFYVVTEPFSARGHSIPGAGLCAFVALRLALSADAFRKPIVDGLVRLLGGNRDGAYDAITGVSFKAGRCAASIVINMYHLRILRLWNV